MVLPGDLPCSCRVSVWGRGSGSMRSPGKSGLTFAHILSRLQGELGETRAEWRNLIAVMDDIHEVWGIAGKFFFR
jgi:hypothetical protein